MKNKSILHFFLVMSAGGYGHIPLPLIRGEIAYADPPDEYSQEVGFLGNMANGPRKQVLEILKQSFVDSNLSHLFAHSKSIPISCNVSILFIFDTVCFFFFCKIIVLSDWIKLRKNSIFAFFFLNVYDTFS